MVRGKRPREQGEKDVRSPATYSIMSDRRDEEKREEEEDALVPKVEREEDAKDDAVDWAL